MKIDERAKLLLKHMDSLSECRVICGVVPSNMTMEINQPTHNMALFNNVTNRLGIQELKIKMDFVVPNTDDIQNLQNMVSGFQNKKFYLVEVVDE